MIDATRAAPMHRCRKPEVVKFGPPRKPGWPPTARRLYDPGTTYHCDVCGSVYVLTWRPGGRQGRLYVASGHVWRPETPRERRKRLGLRWWQRG